MIIFLNFTPINFMGGCEKWISEIASETNKHEKAIVIDVDRAISNRYGKFVLKRTLDSHIKDHNVAFNFTHITLTHKHFLPFTKEWKEVKDYFVQSRLVYERYELIEIIIGIYFGGISSLKKTVAALILTPVYNSPRGIMDKLHNYVYSSQLYKVLLRKALRVHVMNHRDEKLLKEKYQVNNITLLPVGVDFTKFKYKNMLSNKKELNIIYVGELSTRKGVDIVESIIKASPTNFTFYIVGDGPLKQSIKALESEYNTKLFGYVNNKELYTLYNKCDVLLFPSRSEAFGIVMAEAMAFGLKIVNSTEVNLNLPKDIELSSTLNNAKSYVLLLNAVFKEKKEDKINKKYIRDVAVKEFSNRNIHAKFLTQVLHPTV